MQQYASQADAIAVDGAKMPHLFPGTTLNLKTLGDAGLSLQTTGAAGTPTSGTGRDPTAWRGQSLMGSGKVDPGMSRAAQAVQAAATAHTRPAPPVGSIS